MMTISFRRFVVCALGMLLVSAASTASAATITLPIQRDIPIFATTFSQHGQQTNDLNTGANVNLQVGTAGSAGTAGTTRILLGFDVSSLSEYKSIDSITLRLHSKAANSDITGATPFTIEVHEILAANADWVEGFGVPNGGAGDDSGANWNEKDEPNSTPWAGSAGMSTAGVDYGVTTLASQTFNAVPADQSVIDFTFSGTSAQLTALIDNWQTDNAGLTLFHENPSTLASNKRLFFHSSDNGNALLNPELIIEFTAVPIPEPSSFVLLSMALCGFTAARRRKQRKV